MREEIIERGQNPADFPILAPKPELWEDLRYVWEAFMILSASRQMGMSAPQPITMQEVLAYSEFNGISDSDEKEELLHFVQFLDQVFLADFAAKQKKGSPPPPKK